MLTVALLCLSVFDFGRGVDFFCDMNWRVLGVAMTVLKSADTKVLSVVSQRAMSGSA